MIVRHKPCISHLRRAAGRKSPMVFRNRMGVTDMYQGRNLPNPNTPEQQLTRQAWSRSMAAWRALPEELKARWNAFASAHGRAVFPERESAEPVTGYRLFLSAANNRQLLGLSLPDRAPAQLPPPKPERVELLPSVEPDALRLRIFHRLKPGLFRVVVSMTPATARPSRKPDHRHGRQVRGWGTASTASLPESGGEVVFTGCRYAIHPGQRFGVWIRVIRESDGLASPELFLDLIRPVAPDGTEAPAGTTSVGEDGAPGARGTGAAVRTEAPSRQGKATGSPRLQTHAPRRALSVPGASPPGSSRTVSSARLTDSDSSASLCARRGSHVHHRRRARARGGQMEPLPSSPWSRALCRRCSSIPPGRHGFDRPSFCPVHSPPGNASGIHVGPTRSKQTLFQFFLQGLLRFTMTWPANPKRPSFPEPVRGHCR